MVAYDAPMEDTAKVVLAQKRYSGISEPVASTWSTRVGRNKYRGTEPTVRIKKVLRRPIASDTAPQPSRPPEDRHRSAVRSQRKQFKKKIVFEIKID